MYPRVGQVSLMAVCAIVLAHHANMDNPDWKFTIWELTWKRGLMVSLGIVLGLLVTWVRTFHLFFFYAFFIKNRRRANT